KMYVPIFFSTVVWAVSIPIQTAILGHISSDALAANNIASTFYQYAKVVTFAMSSCSGVMIANAIGKGDRELVKQEGRTLSVIDVFLGIALAALLFFLRKPLLSLYTLTPAALALADSLIILQAVIMLGMAYQMPVSFGVIQGGGDAGFVVKMNSICTWCIVIPLTFMGAYWWHVPIVLLVLIIQSDQLFKCLPVFVRFRKYTWIKKLTRDEVAAEG
ncbi:MAG: MATE family efflux transporter, partial [Eubacterium sp.]|nr:MATE family efflux transporter [Eubacterium sp.]